MASSQYVGKEAIKVMDRNRKGMKFSKREEQQCTCCKRWLPFVRMFWPTSLHIVCRQCLWLIEQNRTVDDIRARYRTSRRKNS